MDLSQTKLFTFRTLFLIASTFCRREKFSSGENWGAVGSSTLPQSSHSNFNSDNRPFWCPNLASGVSIHRNGDQLVLLLVFLVRLLWYTYIWKSLINPSPTIVSGLGYSGTQAQLHTGEFKSPIVKQLPTVEKCPHLRLLSSSQVRLFTARQVYWRSQFPPSLRGLR